MPTYFSKCPKIFHYLLIVPTANVHELIWSLIELHEGRVDTFKATGACDTRWIGEMAFD